MYDLNASFLLIPSPLVVFVFSAFVKGLWDCCWSVMDEALNGLSDFKFGGRTYFVGYHVVLPLTTI